MECSVVANMALLLLAAEQDFAVKAHVCRRTSEDVVSLNVAVDKSV